MAEEKEGHWESGNEKMYYISILVTSSKGSAQLKEELGKWAKNKFPSYELMAVCPVTEIIENAFAAQRKATGAYESIKIQAKMLLDMDSRVGRVIDSLDRLTDIVSKLLDKKFDPQRPDFPADMKTAPGKKQHHGTQVDSNGK